MFCLFQAANPKAALEDFVRWYSPRDLIEEEGVDGETGKKIAKCKNLSIIIILCETFNIIIFSKHLHHIPFT